MIEICVKVFSNWDEEFERFNGQLRDLSKKKREDMLKYHFKFNLAHKRLEKRITQMRE